MKTKIFIFVIFFMMWSTPFLNAQQNKVSEVIKIKLEKLFSFSKSNHFQKAAKLIAYRGKDKNRILKDSFNYKNPSEKQKVDWICKRIKKYLLISDSYKIGKLTQRGTKKTHKFILSVLFKSGKQILNIKFEFIKVNGNFLLYSID